MNILVKINTILSLMLVAAISFSLTHAKDITAASTGANHAQGAILSPARSLDNGIHVDFHPHVDHQSLSNLLKTAQNNQPITDTRSLKKIYQTEHKHHHLLRDGLFGFHIPEYI
jgi:hypothetical protein